MKIEKLPSGSYRVRKQINGKKISLTFDYKPTQAEVLRKLSELADTHSVHDSFRTCALSYIKSKENIISPKTAKTYYSTLNSSLSDQFKEKRISDINQQDIQLEVNQYAAEHSPKSVRNLHGFISGVLRQFRPDMKIYTTLPQMVPNEPYTPSEDDIKRILDASKDDHPNHICFQLGIMSLRRSEIMALTLDDIDGNILTINKALVQNSNNEWIIKATKTTASTRKVYLPDCLVDEIRQQGYVYNRHPNKMNLALAQYQKQLGIPHFRFHDLRHFFASYAHAHGISDADILATGGWKSDYTMKRVYRHEMNAEKSQKLLFDNLIQ